MLSDDVLPKTHLIQRNSDWAGAERKPLTKFNDEVFWKANVAQRSTLLAGAESNP